MRHFKCCHQRVWELVIDKVHHIQDVVLGYMCTQEDACCAGRSLYVGGHVNHHLYLNTREAFISNGGFMFPPA